MSRRSHLVRETGLVVLVALGVCGGGASALAQARPALTRVPTNTAAFDASSLIGKHTRSARVIRRGSLSSMAARMVEVAPGKRASLGTVARAAFAEQRTLGRQLGRASSGLFGRVLTRDEGIELVDRFVITRTTSVVVSDPAKVRGKSRAFREFVDGQQGAIAASSLDTAARNGLRGFVREAKRYPAGHPMRVAAEQGEQAVLDAIAAGKGTFEVTDTVVIPRKAVGVRGRTVSAPKRSGDAFQYGSTRAVTLGSAAGRPGGTIRGGTLNRAAQDRVNARTQYVRGGGSYRAKVRRLNGFTYADAWEWERTWRYPSGFFRFGVGAWYGLGMRFPIEVGVMVSPTYIEVKRATDAQMSYNVRFSTKPVNGNEAFYREAGLPSAEVLKGRELVAGGGFFYHTKLRALWTTVLSKRGGKEFHLTGGDGRSGDFTPPIGGAKKNTNLFIPASVTRTRLSFGPLKGSIKLGVKVGMKGRVSGKFDGLVGGRRVACDDRNTRASDPRSPQRFTHRSATQESVYNCKLPRSGASKQTRYGFRISDLKYHADWSMTPGAQGSVTAKYRSWKKRFTLTFWLDSVTIPVGSSTFGTHAGTPATTEWNAGLKVFRKSP